MITRIEATRYRCFERLAVDIGDFRVLVGANGSGKTTLLDIPILLGDLLRATNVTSPFMERRSDGPPRASSLTDLVFAGRGSDLSFAIEAKLPEAIQTEVLEGMLSRLRSENSQRALRNDEKRWPTHIRYEISLRIFNERELHVVDEYVFMFPEADGPERDLGGLHGTRIEANRSWRSIIKREFGYDTEFQAEVPSGRGSRASASKIGLSNVLLALPRVMYESATEYPAARWLYGLLSESAVFLEPDWAAMRLASPPGQSRRIIPSGRNTPWLALDLKREGANEESGPDYRSERYCDWIAHVRTALPQVVDIDVREREDDHHAYFWLSYRGGFEVPSSGLSDGTLRILTLTLLPYLREQPAILVAEQPEDGIHPRAIEAVLQSLSSMYDSQVWVSSHSPIVLASSRLDQLLCARFSGESGVEIIPGYNHPRLKEWKGGIDLGSLFAGGVLG